MLESDAKGEAVGAECREVKGELQLLSSTEDMGSWRWRKGKDMGAESLGVKGRRRL